MALVGHSPLPIRLHRREPSRPQIHQTDRLIRLPDKLILHILDFLARESTHDLRSLALVSRRYHTLADRILYRRILFDSPEHHVILGESLKRRPRRGSLIQDLKLEYPNPEAMLNSCIEQQNQLNHNTDILSRTLSAMSNLETLDIAIPIKFLEAVGPVFNGPFDLACLKHCSLHFQSADKQYWDLRESIHVFTHPTLESLTIKRAKLDERGFDLTERPHSTALKSLRLVECDIDSDSLGDILEFPEGLVELYMYHTAEPEPELEENCEDFSDNIMSLKGQCETMEIISIDFPTLGGRKPLRLREFAAVKTLQLNFDTQLFGKTGKKPRMHSVGLPPNLRTLEFFNPLGDDETVLDLFVIMIDGIDFMARELETLILVEGADGIPDQIKKACEGKKFTIEIRSPRDTAA
ncbi:hypothetical protein ANO11243_066840 [Dothideomycetidae sp. 11243]|nr:hypothetical protein ANO11243_066840 [fungal sp. No.11243]